MKISRILRFLAPPIALLLTPLVYADGVSTTTMKFTGVNGADDGEYYVSPYLGTMNYGMADAQTIALFCDDINNDVAIGQVWNANVTSLASNDLSNTRYGNATDGNPNFGGAANATQLYEEGAWLVSQFATHTGDYASLQHALWDVMTPGVEPGGYKGSDGVTVSQWIKLAEASYGSVDPNNFEIVTNVGPLRYKNQVQEFIVRTPEPSTIVLVLGGLGAMFLFAVARRKPRAAWVDRSS